MKNRKKGLILFLAAVFIFVWTVPNNSLKVHADGAYTVNENKALSEILSENTGTSSVNVSSGATLTVDQSTNIPITSAGTVSISSGCSVGSLNVQGGSVNNGGTIGTLTFTGGASGAVAINTKTVIYNHSGGTVLVSCDGKVFSIYSGEEGNIIVLRGVQVRIDPPEDLHMSVSWVPDKNRRYWMGEKTGTVICTADPGYYFPEDFSMLRYFIGKGYLYAVVKSETEAILEYTVCADDINDSKENFVAINLENPVKRFDNPYTVKGKQGKNGFYVSDVKLVPTAGYSISESKDGTFTDEIVITESRKAGTVYLKDKSNNKVTNGFAVGEIKIDKKAPDLGKVKDGETYYGESSFEIKDDNLSKVTVNGKDQKVEKGIAAISLSSGDYSESYEIIASDQAGNTSRATVKVAVKWLENGIVPDGEAVKLKAHEKLSLGTGSYTLKGDNTVYEGGIEFYVKEDGEYLFTRQ